MVIFSQWRRMLALAHWAIGDLFHDHGLRAGFFTGAEGTSTGLSGAIDSTANTVEDIVREMLTARTSERQGRLIDSDETASMEKKKREGYF